MKHLTHSLAAAAVLAVASMGTALPTTASAQSYYGNGYQRAVPDNHRGYAQNEDRDAQRRGCRASAWDSNARYMPGDTVWRKGKMYVATDVSSHVYNVNSPPEWTPNYWVRAHCR